MLIINMGTQGFEPRISGLSFEYEFGAARDEPGFTTFPMKLGSTG